MPLRETEQVAIWQRVHQFVEHAVEQKLDDEPQDEASNWSNKVAMDSEKVKFWSYADAMKAVPYVRMILRELRESYIRAWHLHRKNHTEFHEQRTKGVAALEELAKLSVLCFERPSRGIALFRFVVYMRD